MKFIKNIHEFDLVQESYEDYCDFGCNCIKRHQSRAYKTVTYFAVYMADICSTRKNNLFIQ